jgi:type IV pilus assembly protein PilC
MRYRYQAKTKEGEDQVGFVEAGTQDAAVTILTGHDLFVLKIESADVSHWYDRLGSYFGGVKREDMVIFSRQLATLLEARLSLNKALKTLEAQTENPALRDAVFQISQDIDAGLSFSQALERQGGIFSGFFISMVRSAEVTGNLDKVSGFLADYIEREAVIATKARSALIYPAVVVGLFLIVAALLVVVVFPQLEPVFRESGVEVPALTQVLLSSGAFVNDWWPVVLVALAVLIAVFLDYARTSEGQALVDEAKIRLPIVRRIFLPLTITRFSNASTMLIRGGVPVAQAMEIVGDTVDNTLYRDILHDVSQDIREGLPLSAAIAKHPDHFPVLVSQMIAVGETTGQLDQIMSRISAFYNREADTVINNLVDLIQPAIMVVIGVMIAFLFAAVLVPLYKLTGALGSG